MAVLSGLCSFALKPLVEGVCAGLGLGLVAEPLAQAAGELAEGSVGRVVDFLHRRIRDESQELFAALRSAHERAWQSLEVALAGESFWSFLSERTDQAFRDQVRRFLDHVPLPPAVRDQADFMKRCVQEIQQARKAGRLGGDLEPAILSRDLGAFARFSAPHAIVAHRHRLAAGLAREFHDGGYENLAHLLAAVDLEDSLLVHALRYFFNRELQRRPRLRQCLDELRWQHVQTALHDGFAAIEDLLERQGPLLEQLLIDAAALRAEARAHYLDLKDELRRLDERQEHAHQELYHNLLDALKANQGAVRVGDSLCVRSGTEYLFVKQLVAQYRQLPQEQRRRLPALMDAIGRLEAHEAPPPAVLPVPPVPVVQVAPLPLVELIEPPVVHRKPPPLPVEPILLQAVVDVRNDFAQYQAAIQKHGAPGERLFLKTHARARHADWQTAAREGDGIGRFLLGLQREHGIGLTRDLTAAAEWYRKAADGGHAAAQCKLGRLYLEGKGVPRDEALAFRWYHKAAEQGHAAAQHRLGEMYAQGRGVPRDRACAEYWYRLAAR